MFLGAGWTPDWHTSWVTDAAPACVKARDPLQFPELNFPINESGSCTDHGIDHVAEDALKKCPAVKDSLDNARTFINHMKDSSLARERFRNIMKEAGEEPLSVIEGTMNRWFYKVLKKKIANS